MSSDLVAEVERRLRERFPQIRRVSARPLIYQIGRARLHVRTASEKAGAKYWFDVTPSIYERRQAHFLLYACGSANRAYVFPIEDFRALIAGAHLGGQKQVPNFTIYCDSNEFEPAGHAERRRGIARYRNRFEDLEAAS